MAPHSSTLAWKIPWTEEPGGLQSMGSLRVGTTERLHFHFHFYALEKEMATHSSILAWRISGTEEPGGLLSMELHRVRHDWSDLAVAVAAVSSMARYAGLQLTSYKPMEWQIPRVHVWSLVGFTQYASKFGKLSSDHRTGKGQFSFQSQRKAMPRMPKLLHNCTHLTC